MKKKIFILLILLLLFSLTSCFGNKNDNKKDNTDDKTEITSYKDQFGVERKIDKNGIWCENVVLNTKNYNNYKDSLLGNSGKSGLLNNLITELSDNEIKKDETNYFVTIMYYVGERIPNLVTYFKATLINENDILLDNDAINTGNIIVNNYKFIANDPRGYADFYGDMANVTLDMSKNSYEKISIHFDNRGYTPNRSLFSFVIPFTIKEEGNVDIDFSISDNNSTFDHHEKINIVIGDYDTNRLATIDNYKVSFISESLCKDGNIDETKLSNKSNFVKNYAKYMVVDFDAKTVEDNDGTGKINVVVHTSNYETFKSSIEDVPSTDFSEEVSKNTNIMKVSLSISRENNANRHYRLIFKMLPTSEENSDIQLFITSKNIPVDEYKIDTFLAKVSNDGLVYNDYNEIVETLAKDINEINIPATHNGEKVSIGAYAFEDCTELVTVNIEEGVESIGEYAFLNCTSLENINFPSSLNNIYSNAFENCNNNLFNQYENSLYIGNDNNDYYIFLKPLNKNLTTYKINANTEVVCSGAFENCENLKNINLFNVKKIGDYVFENCSSLESVVFNNLNSIGKSVFMNCEKLIDINLPKTLLTISDYAFSNSSLKTLTIPSNVNNCGNYILSNCKTIEGLVLDNDILDFSEIKIADFSNSNLKYVYHKLDYYFSNSFVELTNVKFIKDESVKKLNYVKDNFYSYLETNTGKGVNFKVLNKNVISITVPESIETIEAETFKGCRDMTDVYLPSNLKYIEDSAFAYCSVLKNVTLPDSILEIGDKAFMNCYELDNVILPNKINKISNDMFSYCSKLEYILIPENIESVGNNAFLNCSNLKRIILPDSISKFGTYVFKGCDSLNTLTVPFVGKERLTNVNNSSYDYTLEYLMGYSHPDNFKTLIITDSIILSNGAISNYSTLETINLNNITKIIGSNAFAGCEELANVYFDGNISDWCDIKFNSNESTPMYYGTYFYLKNEAGDITFRQNKYSLLENVITPNDVLNIGDYQFYGFNLLKDITILNPNTSFGEYSLDNCDYLEDLYYNGDISNWCNLSFSYNTNPFKNILNFYYLNDEGNIINNGYNYSLLEELVIPETITEIGKYQFSGLYKLTKLTFGENVKKMNGSAFSNCEAFDSVYYNGDISDWCGIEFEISDANPMTYAKNFYYLKDSTYSKLIELEIPNTITEIGDYQFINFIELTTVTIPNEVLKIGTYSFYGCENIEKITLPFIGQNRQNSSTTNTTNINLIFGSNVPEALKEISVTDSTYMPIEALKGCKYIEKINLPDDLTTIARNAFYGCESLKNIVLPNGLTNIGEGAFLGCKLLEEINLPDTLNIISNDAFRGCELINKITIPNNITAIGNGTFYDCKALDEIIIPDRIKIVSERLFLGCESLKDVTLGNATTEISSSAFSGCSSIENIILPDTLTKIGNSAFSSCTSLNNVTIPNTVELGDYVFYNCASLTNIKLPEDMTSIGKYLFTKCSGLISISIPNTVKEIKESAFEGCTSLEAIILPADLTTIAKKAFYNCTSITDIVINETLENVGDEAFLNDEALVNVYYNNTMTKWANISFGSTNPNMYSNPMKYANALYLIDNNGTINYNGNKYSVVEELIISNTYTALNIYNFIGLSTVKNVVVPKTVTSINEGTFNGYSALESISLPFIGAKEYDVYEKFGSAMQTQATDDYYPFGYIFGKDSYEGAEKTSQFYISKGNTDVYKTNGLYYIPTSLKEVRITNSNYLVHSAFWSCKNIKNVYFESNIKVIGSYAFSGCSSIESLIIPASIEHISPYAFSGVTGSITFASGVKITEIERYSFHSYKGTSITIPSTVTKTGSFAFANCSNIEEIKLPHGFESLSGSTFANCTSLKRIYLPRTLTITSYQSFVGCNALNEVYYEGSSIEWNKITGISNVPTENVTIEFNYSY